MILDAGDSYDNDQSPELPSTLQYLWNCQTLKPSISETCSGIRCDGGSCDRNHSSSQVSLLVSTSVINGTVFNFKCSVFEGSRSSDASVQLTVLESDLATVTIL